MVGKRSFLSNVRLFLSTKEKLLNIFKSNVCPIKIADKVLTPNATPDPTPKPTLEPTLFWTPKSTGKSRNKISSLKLHEKFLNKILNDEESVNNEILKNYSGY